MPSVLRIPSLAAASLAGALCALVVGVAVSGAKIVPQKSIAGAKMEMTQKRVLSKLGEPDRTRIKNNPFSGSDYIELKYGRTWVSFSGVVDSSEVWGISTKDPDERTASGVGVGSTKAEVKAGVKGVNCAKEFGINHCYVGEFRPFEVVTDFTLKKKKNKPWRVNRVGIGLVLD
jgi:hypothetical protein